MATKRHPRTLHTRLLSLLFVSLWAFLWPLLLRAEEWPRFRGPTGQGLSSERNLPIQWSATDNIAWKTPIPGDGWSSPVVQGDRVFVTAARDKNTSCHVLCLDRDTGKILWDKEVFKQGTYTIRPKNSFATPTPATDGGRVYAVFGEGGIAALDFHGKIDWTNQDYKFHSVHGLGASPILYKGLLIMSYDGSADPRTGQPETLGWQTPWDGASIVALNVDNGKEVWKAKRGPSRLAHTTPLIIRAGDRDLLVSSAGDVIQGFNPDTGERVWTVRSLGEGVVPSPVYAAGLVITFSGFGTKDIKSAYRAVRPDGQGDVTKTHLAWEQTKVPPFIPTPVPVGEHLYAVTDKGVAACLEAKTGNVLWEERLEKAFSASPVYADGRVYFLAESGETTVIEASPEKLKLVATSSIQEPCQASMAVAHGHLFIRSKQNLWCIGPKANSE
jgi:outer membrane protein assembly factor BamB